MVRTQRNRALTVDQAGDVRRDLGIQAVYAAIKGHGRRMGNPFTLRLAEAHPVSLAKKSR
jgi:hypothetical protein